MSVCQANRHVTATTNLVGSWLGRAERCEGRALLLRHLNLMYHLYHLQMRGDLDEERWAALALRGLVTVSEQQRLVALQKMGSEVHRWLGSTIEGFRAEGALTDFQAYTLDSHVTAARGLAAKQIACTLTGVPFPYYHLLTTSNMVLVTVLLWNSAVRFCSEALPDKADPHEDPRFRPVSAAFEVAGSLFIVVAFQTIHRVAVRLIEPFGDYDTNY